jgi:hypothetical protein
MNQPDIESWTMTDATFGTMSWHDVPLHGALHLSQTREMAFDIDYIVEWIKPTQNEVNYRHWSAPATLVFHNVCRFVADVEPYADTVFLGIGPTEDPIEVDITRPAGEGILRWWSLKCPVGYWRLLTSGFTQYFRGAPVLTTGGRIDLARRGGLSFARRRQDAGAA